MKISRTFSKTFMSFAVVAAVVAAGVGVAYAATANQFTSGYTNKSIYKFGNNITITGTVNGDIYCAGQTITIDATVNGDVICAGQSVNLNGRVLGDVRVAGQTVSINADISNNASIAGQDIEFSSKAKVGRDLSVAGQTVSIDSPIGRDAQLAGATLYVNSSIGRNVSAHATEKLILQDKAKVGGNLSYTSPVTVIKTGSASVSGKVTYTKLEQKGAKKNWQVAWRIYTMLAMICLVIVLVALFPRLFRKWNVVAVEKLGWVLLTGLIGAIAVPVLIVISFATLVGAPIGILLTLLWIVAFILSFPFAIYFVGHSIFPKMNPVLMVLIAAFLIGVIQMIPIIGGIITGLAYLLGTGVILLNLKAAYKKPDYSRK